MPFDFEFLPSALKDWEKLGSTIREQFKKKLAERHLSPRVPAFANQGLPDCYRVKLRQAGYRLVYRVEDARVTVVLVAVGKRETGVVYEKAGRHLR